VNVLLKKVFLKDLASLPSRVRGQVEQFVFQEMPGTDSVQAVGKIEKMQGYAGYYKIRFGDYRVGMKVEGRNVTFERVLHRKEIYRKFP